MGNSKSKRSVVPLNESIEPSEKYVLEIQKNGLPQNVNNIDRNEAPTFKQNVSVPQEKEPKRDPDPIPNSAPLTTFVDDDDACSPKKTVIVTPQKIYSNNSTTISTDESNKRKESPEEKNGDKLKDKDQNISPNNNINKVETIDNIIQQDISPPYITIQKTKSNETDEGKIKFIENQSISINKSGENNNETNDDHSLTKGSINNGDNDTVSVDTKELINNDKDIVIVDDNDSIDNKQKEEEEEDMIKIKIETPKVRENGEEKGCEVEEEKEDYQDKFNESMRSPGTTLSRKNSSHSKLINTWDLDSEDEKDDERMKMNNNHSSHNINSNMNMNNRNRGNSNNVTIVQLTPSKIVTNFDDENDKAPNSEKSNIKIVHGGGNNHPMIPDNNIDHDDDDDWDMPQTPSFAIKLACHSPPLKTKTPSENSDHNVQNHHNLHHIHSINNSFSSNGSDHPSLTKHNTAMTPNDKVKYDKSIDFDDSQEDFDSQDFDELINTKKDNRQNKKNNEQQNKLYNENNKDDDIYEEEESFQFENDDIISNSSEKLKFNEIIKKNKHNQEFFITSIVQPDKEYGKSGGGGFGNKNRLAIGGQDDDGKLLQLSCISCGFDVLRFRRCQWSVTTDYMHFRNYNGHSLNLNKLCLKLCHYDHGAAYACQCAWQSVTDRKDLSPLGTSPGNEGGAANGLICWKQKRKE